MKTFANLFTVVLLLSVGCINDQGKDTSLFGSYYNMIQTQTQPALTTDSLFVRVGYSGCSGNHPFSLKYRVISSSTAEVWAFKEKGEPCDSYFEESRVFAIPNEVRNSSKVILLGPQDKRFALK